MTESAVHNYKLGLRASGCSAWRRSSGHSASTQPSSPTTRSRRRDAIEGLFRLEEGFGARPEADAGGARVAVDPSAPGVQKLDAAVGAWAAMRARRDSGEISAEEYLDWNCGLPGFESSPWLSCCFRIW